MRTLRSFNKTRRTDYVPQNAVTLVINVGEYKQKSLMQKIVMARIGLPLVVMISELEDMSNKQLDALVCKSQMLVFNLSALKSTKPVMDILKKKAELFNTPIISRKTLMKLVKQCSGQGTTKNT